MPRRLTQDEFINRCIEIYGNEYDYSKAKYINCITKVCIICPKHGEFMITPNDFLRGHKCPKCSGVARMTTNDFILKAKEKYGEKYDYSKVEYANNKTKVCIICHEKDKYGKEHGEFWQRPNDHLSGYECPKCKNEYKPTTEEWIEKANIIHENKYDYSKVKYESALKKVCIICPEHGEFWQTPNNHINGCNCPCCNSDNKSKMEQGICNMLVDAGINFERQKTFEWLRHKRHLFLDFYIEKYRIAIEVDGEQHFRPVKRFGGKKFYDLQQKRDLTKEKLCEEHGIRLFHITKRNYNIQEIIDIINNGTAK